MKVIDVFFEFYQAVKRIEKYMPLDWVFSLRVADSEYGKFKQITNIEDAYSTTFDIDYFMVLLSVELTFEHTCFSVEKTHNLLLKEKGVEEISVIMERLVLNCLKSQLNQGE